jgi:2-hydroxychromene-2-carboxylate isomerase
VAPATGQPAFYYDLGDPWSYLVAERILADLPRLAEWHPVHGAQLGWVPGEPDAAALAAAAQRLGLLPLRLPARWPPDTRRAMLAATFAKSGGKTVGFSLAAFRQAFAAGRDLGDEATVLLAAAAAEMHPRSVLKAIEMRSISDALRRAGERAASTGVTALPAIDLGDVVFAGPDALARATAALSASAVPGR